MQVMCLFKLFLSGHSLNRWCKLSVVLRRPVMVKSVTTEVLLCILGKISQTRETNSFKDMLWAAP